jgi:hypothetical protein
MEIKVDMLVEIVDGPGFYLCRDVIGRTGTVVKRNIEYPHCWDLDIKFTDPGSGKTLTFPDKYLRPISDPSAFQTFLGEVFKPVDLSVDEKVKL